MTLYLPKFCIIPLAARLDNDLPDAAKIYLGELNALTNKHGYCWASDDELAKMKGVSEKTIQRWHSALEEKGFIRRDTWKEHYTDPKKAGVLIKTKRKIFIIDSPDSNKVAEGTKMSPHCEGTKMSLHCDPTKMSPLSKEPIKQETLTNKGALAPPPPAPPSRGCAPAPSSLPPVSSSFGSLKINEKTAKKVQSQFTPEQISQAVAACEAIETRVDDSSCLWTALTEAWKVAPSKHEREKTNVDYLFTLRNLDMKRIRGTQIVVGSSYVEFITGHNGYKMFKIEDLDFKQKVSDELNRLGIK